jgi:hypothetical protein
VHDSHISELPDQAYLEVGRIYTEEGTEVILEELHVKPVKQMPAEVQLSM